VKHTDMVQGNLFLNAEPFEYKYDYTRLKTQRSKIFAYMSGEQWRTLSEISTAVNAPEASASAALRDFRKLKYGSHTVDRRIRGDRVKGLWEYRLLINKDNTSL